MSRYVLYADFSQTCRAKVSQLSLFQTHEVTNEVIFIQSSYVSNKYCLS